MSSTFNPKYWPLNADGEIPASVFDQQALWDALFKSGMHEWKCTRRAIRQAMKALAKRHGVAIPDYSKEIDIEERDRRLTWIVCSNADARKGFGDLEILGDEKSGPRRTRQRSIKVDGFAETIWDLLIRRSENKEIASLAKWSLEHGRKRGDLGQGGATTWLVHRNKTTSLFHRG